MWEPPTEAPQPSGAAVVRPLVARPFRHDEAQLVARQAEWVARARQAGLAEPTRVPDPITASAEEVARAVQWSEIGGVIPRFALEADGGRAFTSAVRDAVVYRTEGLAAPSHPGDPASPPAAAALPVMAGRAHLWLPC